MGMAFRTKSVVNCQDTVDAEIQSLSRASVVVEDLARWEKELLDFPAYKAALDKKADEREQRRQERADKKQIFRAAKTKKAKAAVRPGRLGLQKLKPIVKNGKLTRKGRLVDAERDIKPNPSKRRRKVAMISKSWTCISLNHDAEWAISCSCPICNSCTAASNLV